jgi:hypothetical protein
LYTLPRELDLLLQVGGAELGVADELDVPHERPLGHDEGDLHATLEVLDLHLDVVEEAEGEDSAEVLGRLRRVEGGAHRGADAAQDDRLLHPAVTLHRELPNDDGTRGRRRRSGLLGFGNRDEKGERCQGSNARPTYTPP